MRRLALLSSTVLLAAAAAPAQRVPEAAEPNQTMATATLLGCGQEAFGTLPAGDIDWFRVVLSATSDLTAQTMPSPSSSPGPGIDAADVRLVLLDATGSPLRANEDGVQSARHARLSARGLAPGTYYLAVEPGPLAVTGGSYALDVRCAAPTALPAAPIVAEGPENNDPRSGGTPTTVALPARCSGNATSVGATGDWDFWRFLLLQDGVVRARVAATASHPTPPVLDDPVLYLFDGASPPNLLLGPVHARDYGSFDTGFDVRLSAGLYQVAIRGFQDSIAGRYYLDLARLDAARATVFVGGCGGRTLAVATAGTGPGSPLVIERPAIGTTYTVLGSGLGAGGFAFHAIGFASTFVDLTPLGAPGCALEVVYADTILAIADAAGHASWSLAVPEDPSLLGTALESQVAVLDFSNPLGITLSNRVAAVVGH
jgi:hypothetical protein